MIRRGEKFIAACSNANLDITWLCVMGERLESPMEKAEIA